MDPRYYDSDAKSAALALSRKRIVDSSAPKDLNISLFISFVCMETKKGDSHLYTAALDSHFSGEFSHFSGEFSFKRSL